MAPPITGAAQQLASRVYALIRELLGSLLRNLPPSLAESLQAFVLRAQGHGQVVEFNDRRFRVLKQVSRCWFFRHPPALTRDLTVS